MPAFIGSLWLKRGTTLPARESIDWRRKNGDGGMGALLILKCRLSKVVFRTVVADQSLTSR
jgi:hypothetical protein